MRQKYEVALKEKMLIKLERDRAVGLLASMPNPDGPTPPNTSSTAQQTTKSSNNNKGPTQTRLEAARNQYTATTKKEQQQSTLLSNKIKDTQWPTDQAVNPALENAKKIQHQLR